jgi:hypothetical protein|tara:strand:- start:254 stop:733 length:480 start_codon:yes stop_codon:yes gene_type:complete
MNQKKLLKFIAKAHRNTYAAPKEIKAKYKCKKPILPGHKDYEFIDGDFIYHDSYSGWKMAPGKEVIFYKNKPVWCMSYQGNVDEKLSEEFVEEIYSFLKKALMNFKDNIPFRGLNGFKEGDFEYKFSFKGDYSYFVGRESVFYKGKEVFFQDVMGSVIK